MTSTEASQTTEAMTTAAMTNATMTTAAMTNATMTTAAMETTPVACVPTDSCDGHYTCDADTGDKVCNAGYKGAECTEKEYNGPDDPECPSLGKCKNGGTCWNNTCCCAKGYEGQLCGSDIIECQSNPCVNEGTCKEGDIGEYKCICPEGKSTDVFIEHISAVNLFAQL